MISADDGSFSLFVALVHVPIHNGGRAEWPTLKSLQWRKEPG
jgi:hypothetical protein